MANKNIFNSQTAVLASVPATDGVNLAGGKAYSLSAKQALAQFAVTGTFNGTFYASGEDQLKAMKGFVNQVEPSFLAALAVYSRKSAFMKDMPAYLLAVLSTKDIGLFKQTFPLVVDNMKMLRNFVQIMRSGVTGRKSFGSAPKKAIQAWIDSRTDEQLFNESVGNDPKLIDIFKLIHVKANTPSREALFKYLMGFKDSEKSDVLPGLVKEFEAFKANVASTKTTPAVSFEMLTALPLTNDHWKGIATNAKWHMTRMNLNTFARHGVLKDSKMVDMIATRLKDEKAIANAKVFPYQLFAAYKQTSTSSEVPLKVTNALQDALELSTKNVPVLKGKKIAIGVDISGSMRQPITGNRGRMVSSSVMCHEVAALFAASLLKANEDSTSVFQFDTHCKPMKGLNARDSLMTNIQKIAFNGGGTDCSSTIRYLNDNKIKSDLVLIISDNESWAEMSSDYSRYQNGTTMARAWATFKSHNPNAKLVCLDLVPQTHVQVKPQKDVLCVGGFSDSVFDVIRTFVESDSNDPDFFVKTVESKLTV